MKSKFFFLVLAISLLSHLLFFGRPNQPVFDEVFFGNFSQNYLEGKYFFDIHPPLGKMLIAGTAKLMGYSHYQIYGPKNEKYPTNDYLLLRFLPLIAGIMLGPLLYLISRMMDFSERASVLAGIFASIDSALVIQSRFILIDSLLLFFGLTSVYFFLKYVGGRRWHDLTAAGFLGAFAASVKWTGLGFLGLIALFFFILLIKSGKIKTGLLNGIISLFILPVILYVSVFALHFRLLGKSGSGDYRHTPGFQKTLAGSFYENIPKVKPLGFFGKFAEENSLMLSADRKTSDTHEYSSKWYGWPFPGKSIFYWSGQDGKKQAEIRFVGNPIIWCSGFLSVLFVVAKIILAVFRKEKFFRMIELKKWDTRKIPGFAPVFIIAGFMINFLPFALIHRYMFSYHYLPALLFSLLALAYTVDKITSNKKLIFFLYLGAILFYIAFFPRTYGVSIF